MSTIQTTLSLKDAISKPLRDITRALNETADAIARIEDTTINTAFDDMSESMEDATDDADKFSDSLGDIPDSSNGLNKVPAKFSDIGQSIVVANQALQLMNQLINTVSSSFSKAMSEHRDNLRGSTQLEVTLANNLSTAYELDKAMSQIQQTSMDIENATGIASGSLVAGAAELSTYITDVDALALSMQTLADYAVGMSGDINISQDAMVNYATQIGKALDGTYDGLRKKGFILTEQQKQIIEYGTEMERALVISDVINESWEDLAETMGSTAIGAIAKFERQVVNTQALIGQALTEIKAHFLGLIMDIGINVEAMVVKVRTVFIDNLEAIATALILLGVVGAALAAKWLVIWAIKLLPVIKVAVVIMGIVKWLNIMGITNSQILGAMFAAWNVIKYTIMNIWITWENYFGVLTTIWKNLNDDALGTIKRAWFDALTGIAKLYNATIGSLAEMAGLDWKIDIDAREAERALMGENKYKWEMIPYHDAIEEGKKGWERGNEVGDKLDDTIQNLKAFDWDATSLGLDARGGIGAVDMPDFGSLNDFATNAGGGKALNVHNTEPLEISGENVKMLRDLATKQAVVNYRQVTPNINITTGDILETADVNGIVDKLTEDLTDYLSGDLGSGFA